MKNWTMLQKLGLAMALLSFAAATVHAPQFLKVAGPDLADLISFCCATSAGFVGVIITFMTSQKQQVLTVAEMAGVANVVANDKASDALKAIVADSSSEAARKVVSA